MDCGKVPVRKDLPLWIQLRGGYKFGILCSRPILQLASIRMIRGFFHHQPLQRGPCCNLFSGAAS